MYHHRYPQLKKITVHQMERYAPSTTSATTGKKRNGSHQSVPVSPPADSFPLLNDMNFTVQKEKGTIKERAPCNARFVPEYNRLYSTRRMTPRQQFTTATRPTWSVVLGKPLRPHPTADDGSGGVNAPGKKLDSPMI